jgi:cAMP-dependent protein kinase regulator
MTQAPAPHGLSAIDRAHALWLGKPPKPEDALRLAAASLTASPEDLGALWLVARLLLEGGRVEPAGQLAAYGVDASLRRGELASAWLCAQLALEAGGFADDALRRIADAFGAGSKRLSDGAPPPPPLPADGPVPPLFANASGAALLDAAEKAAKRVTEHKHSLPLDGPITRVPLFSALPPAQLLRLLNVIELREALAGEHVVKQGDEGREAFLLGRGVLNVVREDGKQLASAAAAGGDVLLAVLGPGALFGEMALVSDAPRAASVVAVEPTQLLCMPKHALEALAHDDAAIGRELGRFCHDRMLANLMRHSAVLSAVPAASRGDLLSRFGSATFEPGETLVQEGTDQGMLYLLASGRVRVLGRDAEGDQVLIAQLGPGDVVGEISLVLRRPANADVVATHRTVCLTLSRDALHEAMREHPSLLAQLYEIAVKRDDETRTVVAQAAVEVLL